MTKAPQDDDPLNALIAYYRARAPEYDQWFLRQGRYDRGPELNRRWFEEIATVRRAIADLDPLGHVLELACGTGLWTEHLLKYSDRITALDAVPETLAISRARLKSASVQYVEAQIFDWSPQREFDVVFFAFWLSHVPLARFADFWQLVGRALKQSGRVFFVDSRYEATSTAKDHRLEDPNNTIVERRLNDGREFRITKVFYQPEELTKQLAGLGWTFRITETPSYFIYGIGQRRDGE
jgi:demethylmenaquinone methyltransferase/2-methoxy-6-polyprenyl-1,4-benzoquinol methylase